MNTAQHNKIAEQIARLSEYQYRKGYLDAVKIYGTRGHAKAKAEQFFEQGIKENFSIKKRNQSEKEKGIRQILQDITELKIKGTKELRFFIYKYLNPYTN